VFTFKKGTRPTGRVPFGVQFISLISDVQKGFNLST